MGCTPELEQLSAASLATGGLFKHSTATEIADHLGYALWNEYLKVSFVRNPWDAVLSRFLYLQKNIATADPAQLRDTLLRSGLALGPEDFKSLAFTDYIRAIGDFSRYPYQRFLRLGPDKYCCDFIGRFEFLERDFIRFCRLVGLEPADLPRANTSAELRESSAYACAYNEASMRVVEQVFAEDIQRFGYKFG
jgi:hypothetical protein